MVKNVCSLGGSLLEGGPDLARPRFFVLGGTVAGCCSFVAKLGRCSAGRNGARCPPPARASWREGRHKCVTPGGIFS